MAKVCYADECKAAQVALAARPSSAWFLAADEREWLQRRQDREQARRQTELAASGKAWGALSALASSDLANPTLSLLLYSAFFTFALFIALESMPERSLL